ncbi:hypothetical protein BU17DRAFT_77645 [Hysterangium stoloniferum]|nr:hypothetical protein BU17DRAFT_77645 [Hysterangium stoloniferum]
MGFNEENPNSHNSLDTLDNARLSRTERLMDFLFTDVDPDSSSLPLAAYCYMTGFIDSVTFTAVSVWCGFQTVHINFLPHCLSRVVNLALAVARLFAMSDVPGRHFRLIDQQSLASILTFLGGAFLGRIGDHMGNRTRAWLFLGTFIQALFTMVASILLFKAGQSSFNTHGPTWTEPLGFAALGFASASMGLQGIMGKRVNTQFATTIVLTTVWCELMAEPKLFRASLVRSRDLKVIAVASLFVGGFAGRALVDKFGDSVTFAIGAGIRVIIALMWLWVPKKRQSENEDGVKEITPPEE